MYFVGKRRKDRTPNVKCAMCSEPFWVYPYIAKKKKNVYCSAECLSMVENQRLLDRWASAEVRKRHSVIMKEALAGVWDNPIVRKNHAEGSKVQAEKVKKLWMDPNYKAMQSISRSQAQQRRYESEKERNLTGEATRKSWLDPEIRNKRVKGQKNSLRLLYSQGVLKPPKMTSGRFEQGYIKTKKGGRFYYKCSWERLLAEMLDSSPLVKSFAYEPFGIQYIYKGCVRIYFPDFLVKLKNGRRFLLELKGPVPDKVKTATQIEAAAEYCELHGIEFDIFTKKPVQPVSRYLQ